jgi:hypothetical protein
MVTSEALPPARPVVIDPTFGRYPLALVHLPADVAMTSRTSMRRTLRIVTTVTAAALARRHDRMVDPECRERRVGRTRSVLQVFGDQVVDGEVQAAGVDDAGVAGQLAASDDPADVEESTVRLRQDLLNLDVDEVRPVGAGEIPPGARAVDVAAVGTVLVALQQSTDLITSVVGLVRSWAESRQRGNEVEMTVGEHTIRLTGATSKQQERLVDQFIEAVSRG